MKYKKELVGCLFVIGIVLLLVVCIALLFPSASGDRLDIFKAIPEKPEDFDAYARDIWTGAFVELCDISDGYWKQPEFYGGSWENSKGFYENPDYSRWGVYGQGNMPTEVSYTFGNLKKGEEFKLCTFFHNGFGIWTYQGFKLLISQNEYFDVEVTPSELTMSPTFPVFEDGWVEKIEIKLTAKEDVPLGNYNFFLDAAEPSHEYSKDKTKEILQMTVNKEDYKKECFRFLKDEERCEWLINNREKKYINGGAYQTSQPLLRIGMNVK